ncbi:MAG TPA: Rieske (2Fe-2S) protein, partial [Bdellovibrionales bacterium]|nr:Rieske (2Fe-2S) protein [Bdellovibrionales bacterium]
MDRDLSELNQSTQPIPTLRVFNNWEAVPLGWYAACESRALKRGKALTLRLCDQQIVLFRGYDGVVRALDAFCPHMGLNLALGRVEGNELRCKFHGWKFNGRGACTEVPCDEAVPRKAKLESYAAEEQYGFVWVYPANEAPEPVFVPFALRGKKLAALPMEVLDRKCHPHVPMVNGMDAQHVKAVHNIDLVPTARTTWHADNCLEIYLGGPVPAHGLTGRLINWVLGGYYAYSNIFIDGTMALLNTVKDVKLFGRYQAPEAYLIFSLKYANRGKAEILPIAVTERRAGLLGWLTTKLMLRLTKAGFDRLKSDEGEWFFENLRFRADALLPHFDRPIATLIQFINKQKLSKWSKTPRAVTNARAAEAPEDFYFLTPPPPPVPQPTIDVAAAATPQAASTSPVKA